MSYECAWGVSACIPIVIGTAETQGRKVFARNLNDSFAS